MARAALHGGSQPLPRADAATRTAMRELRQLLRRLGPRGSGAVRPGNARTHAARGGRMPRLSALPLPPDYASRTGLPRQAEPALLVDAGRDAFGRRAWLQPAAARDWRRMRAAAAADGVTLQLVSAFRHAAYQTRLFERKLARGATIEQILGVNAAPGYSEHHSGRAIDLTTPGCAPAEEAFEDTARSTGCSATPRATASACRTRAATRTGWCTSPGTGTTSASTGRPGPERGRA